MTRRIRQALIFGGVGTAILLLLGTWQLQRLAWKEGLIAKLEAKLAAPPAALPAAPEEAAHEYLRVALAGRFLPGEVHVLGSARPFGPGFRVVAPFETEGGRRVLVDRGFVPQSAKDAPREAPAAEVVGALLWPDDSGFDTPSPDLAANIWFSRDVAAMAAVLGTEPVLIVAETAAPPGASLPAPRPVTPELRNHHLQYALTWFSLATIWAVMTLVVLWRLGRRGAI